MEVGVVNLVVALRPEARPLIDFFGLERRPCGVFETYERESVRLVVSGVGTESAATAVGYLAGLAEGARQQAWLNVGIAGHRDLPLGEARQASRLVDSIGNRSFYPQYATTSRFERAEVRTVAVPERDFASDALYDMEATGFFAAAARFSSAELVHVLKVVSDNAGDPERWPEKSAVNEWISAHLASLEGLVQDLRSLAGAERRRLRDPILFAECLNRWHFTHSQRVQLKQLLRRHESLSRESSTDESRPGEVEALDPSLSNARSVLAHFRTLVQAATSGRSG